MSIKAGTQTTIYDALALLKETYEGGKPPAKQEWSPVPVSRLRPGNVLAFDQSLLATG